MSSNIREVDTAAIYIEKQLLHKGSTSSKFPQLNRAEVSIMES